MSRPAPTTGLASSLPRPKTQCGKARSVASDKNQGHAPAFYWRGGDGLSDQETLNDEYIKAYREFREAKAANVQVTEELNARQEELIQLMDDAQESDQEIIKLRFDVHSTNAQIDDLRRSVDESRRRLGQRVQLQDDKAKFEREREQLVERLKAVRMECQESGEDFARLLNSPHSITTFDTGVSLAAAKAELDVIQRKLKGIHGQFGKPGLIAPDSHPEARSLRAAAIEVVPIMGEIDDLSLKKERLAHAGQARQFLYRSRIGELQEALEALRIEVQTGEVIEDDDGRSFRDVPAEEAS